MSILNDALRYVFFPDADRCPYCGREGARGTCPVCAEELLRLEIETEQPADRICAYYHDGLARDAVLGLKFYNKRYLARAIARELLPLVPEGAELLTCVPLHKSRLRQRGYNQSELIARELSALGGLPYEELLTRTRSTPVQSGIHEHDRRRANVKGAFCLRADADPAGRRIIIIDDVITTGATIEECMLVLRRRGAASVTAISFTAPR